MAPTDRRPCSIVLVLSVAIYLGACSATAPDPLTDEPSAIQESASPTPPPSDAPTAPIIETTPSLTAAPAPTDQPRQLVHNAVPSPDGLSLAIVDNRGVQMHDAATFEVLWRAPLEGLVENLRLNAIQIAWTDDSQVVNVANRYENYGPVEFHSNLSRFDARSGDLLWQVRFDNMPTISFAPDGDHFLLMSLHQDVVQIWDAATQSQTGTFELPERGNIWNVYPQNWSPDRSMIATTLTINTPVTHVVGGGLSGGTEENKNIYIWDAITGKLIAKLDHPHQQENDQKTVLWSPDASRLISPEEDCFIFWDTATWSYRYEILYDPQYNYAGPVTLSPDGSRLFSRLTYLTTSPFESFKWSMSWWNTQTLQELPLDPTLMQALAQGVQLQPIGWSLDGQSLILQGGGSVYYLDLQSGSITTSFPIPDPNYEGWWTAAYINFYQLSPDGSRIYAITPQAVVVYDAHAGEVLATLAD